MTTLTELWPPFALRVRLGDLELALPRDEDFPELVGLAVDGVHDPDFMPFSTPWTDADPDELPANMARYVWSQRVAARPEQWSLEFLVRRAGEAVGVQAVSTKDFAVTRTGETGSWLGRRFHRQGIGTRMRQAVCALAFDHLGFEEVTSAAFLDNPASLGVSRKVGYVPNGVVRLARRGAPAPNARLLLTPDAFVRPDEPVEVEGADAVRRFLGIPAH